VICIHCGLDFRAGTRLETVVKRAPDYVDFGRPQGIALLVVVMGLLFLVAVLVAVALFSESKGGAGVMALLIGAVVAGLPIVLATGTFKRISVSKAPEGDLSLTKTQYVGFVPIPIERSLNGYDSIHYDTITYEATGPPAGCYVVALLMIFAGVIPGILILWILLRDYPDVAVSQLEIHGKDRKPLFVCKNVESEPVRHVMNMLSGATQLPVKRGSRLVSRWRGERK
jgi:hypothetical protein